MSSPTSCPRCAAPLVPRRAGLHQVLGCASCGGVWLDAVASRRAMTDADPALVAEADAASRAASVPFAAAGPGARPRCPVCAAPLVATSIDVAGVVVDTCAAHGTWFDRDELQEVAHAAERIRRARAGDDARSGAGARSAGESGGDAASDVLGDVGTGVAVAAAFELIGSLFDD